MTASATRLVVRAVFRNAVTWGAVWFAASFAIIAAMSIAGDTPPDVGGSLVRMVAWAVRFGVWGGLAGAVFAGLVRLAYRGRRLAQIGWVRFGLLGGLATSLFVVGLMQFLNILSGDGPVPMHLVTDDAVITAVFGAVAAGGSLRLAQRAERRLPSA